MSPKGVIHSDDDIRIQVVTTAEQFMHAMAVRAICFMEDTGLTADQIIDGNDYQATHILAYVKQEPVGVTRLRWLRDFAKIERIAFRPAYRTTRILRHCSDFISDHVSRKGYALLVTHVEPQYARFWQRVFGFERSEGRPLILAPGHEPYIELIKRLSPASHNMTSEARPQMLFGIEKHAEPLSALEASDE
jgi:hypothetical protein